MLSVIEFGVMGISSLSLMALCVMAFACKPVVDSDNRAGDGGVSRDGGSGDASSEACALCSEFADCVALADVEVCRCQAGYTGDGQNCQDINECEFGGGVCGERAVCTNYEGSFNCSCEKGYVGDGYTCRNNLIFYASDTNQSNRFLRSFNIQSGTVTQEPLMPLERNDFCCGPQNPLIVAVSGSMHVFSQFGQRLGQDWQEVNYPSSQKRVNQGSGVIGDKIYVIGAVGGSDRLDSYDAKTEVWSAPNSLRSFPFAVESPAVAGLGGKLYVVGGDTGNDGTSQFGIYDPGADTWQLKNFAPFQDPNAVAASDGSFFYVFASGQLWRYQPGSDFIDRLGDLPRDNALPAVVGQQLFAVSKNNNNMQFHQWTGDGFTLVFNDQGINFIGNQFHVGGSN